MSEEPKFAECAQNSKHSPSFVGGCETTATRSNGSARYTDRIGYFGTVLERRSCGVLLYAVECGNLPFFKHHWYTWPLQMLWYAACTIPSKGSTSAVLKLTII